MDATVPDGAEWRIEHRPGAAFCRTCGLDVRLDEPILWCPRGRADPEITGGRELRIVSMEVG
jgi:hydrogenase nickel incorporation protein HypA/HybF